MSKTQEKRARRLAEQQEFLRARKIKQLTLFEEALEFGLKVYQDNKDKLTPEDIEKIESELVKNRELVEKLRGEIYPTT